MITYIGNCSEAIDWNSVIKHIETQEPGYIGPRQNWDDPEVKEFADIWKDAGYKPVREGGSAEWSMFFPGTNFSFEIVEQFAEFYKMSKWSSAWISRIMPGQCAPWHKDLQVSRTANPDRIHCHIDIIDPGHMLIVEDSHLYNQQQGSAYRWDNPLLWHASFNLGRKPAYLFNIY